MHEVPLYSCLQYAHIIAVDCRKYVMITIYIIRELLEPCWNEFEQSSVLSSYSVTCTSSIPLLPYRNNELVLSF